MRRHLLQSDKRVGTRSEFSPPPTFNVDNQVIFSLFVGKTRYFPTSGRGNGGYVIQLSVPATFGRDGSFLESCQNSVTVDI